MHNIYIYIYMKERRRREKKISLIGLLRSQDISPLSSVTTQQINKDCFFFFNTLTEMLIKIKWDKREKNLFVLYLCEFGGRGSKQVRENWLGRISICEVFKLFDPGGERIRKSELQSVIFIYIGIWREKEWEIWLIIYLRRYLCRK